MKENCEIDCQRCGEPEKRENMTFSKDCHGIPYRLVCEKCTDEIREIGYDGELYDEFDENIDEDY